MKAKRRHELQTNILADYLGRLFSGESGSGGEGLKKMAIVGLIAVGAVVLAIVVFSSTGGSGDSPRAWSDLYLALDQSDEAQLEQVVDSLEKDKQGKSQPALWAKQSLADMDLRKGAQLIHTKDRDKAVNRLKSAIKNYQSVADDDNAPPMLKRRARFGLAMSHECLAAADEKGHKENFDKALELYGKLAQQQNEAIGKAAARRKTALESVDMKEWYAWYSKETPGAPLDDKDLPFDLQSMPDRPDLTVPDFTAPESVIPDELKGDGKKKADATKKKADAAKKPDAGKKKPDAGKKKPDAGKKKSGAGTKKSGAGKKTSDAGKKNPVGKKAPAKKKADSSKGKPAGKK